MIISGDEVISCILKKLTPCLPQDGKAFICYKYLNPAIKCHAELVSASHETLKRVQGDNKTGIVSASCAIIAGLR